MNSKLNIADISEAREEIEKKEKMYNVPNFFNIKEQEYGTLTYWICTILAVSSILLESSVYLYYFLISTKEPVTIGNTQVMNMLVLWCISRQTMRQFSFIHPNPLRYTIQLIERHTGTTSLLALVIIGALTVLELTGFKLVQVSILVLLLAVFSLIFFDILYCLIVVHRRVQLQRQGVPLKDICDTVLQIYKEHE